MNTSSPSHASLNARIRKHALERLNFAASHTEVPAAQRLAACKTFLRLETAMTRTSHDAGESGVAVARARAATIDAMLVQLFDYAIASWKRAHPAPPEPPPPEVTLVALGGYGRGELNPLSDIDLMFLYPANTRLAALEPFQKHLVNEILYPLWDCGLKVGHSSRTIDDAFAQARDNIQTKTALTEARRVAGSKTLFNNFTAAFENFYRNEGVLDYIATRLKNQGIRRAKYGGTVFLQEPDIKYGVGGLRDYHSVLWLAHVRLGIHDINDLVTENYLRRNQLRDFKRAHDFLMRVRNELHFNIRHPADLLNLEQQPRVAHGLGYTNDDALARVERFMRDYYRAAQCIYRVSRIIEDRLALTADPAMRNLSAAAAAAPNTAAAGLPLRESLRLTRQQKTSRFDGFIHRGNELTAEHPGILREDPARLIRVFRHCQQYNAQPDFALQELIRDSLPLINRRLQNSPECATAFRSITHTVGAVYPALSLMHELGVLGRYIPEFDTLTCLVQHEYYHRYTADIHTLNAIRELDRIFLRDETFTAKYLTALHETPAPSLLYLTLLLHDIGKADGVRGHAENGALKAATVLERLRVAPAMRPLVTFAIKYHLAMSRAWQHRDVDDPRTAAAFAETVQTADNLRYLYVHTFCDARGTSAQLWNSYKDSLHTALYRATSERLTHDTAEIAAKNSERAQAKLKELNELLAAPPAANAQPITPDEITAHFNALPERYFLQTDTAEIALHIRMITRYALMKNGQTAPADARAVTTASADKNAPASPKGPPHSTLGGGEYPFSDKEKPVLAPTAPDKSAHGRVCETLGNDEEKRRALKGRDNLPEVCGAPSGRGFPHDESPGSRGLDPGLTCGAPLARESRLSPLNRHGGVPAVVDWRDDLNRALSIVNTVTQDRPGLFYKLAGALSVAGVNILGAKITTRSDRVAIDTFYVVEPGGGAVQNPAAFATFEKTIAQALAGDHDLYPDIVAQAQKHAARFAPANAAPDTLQHAFAPVIDVYHEPATQRTIVEIQARDQIGLLYRITKTISDHGFDITFARIGTERGIAIDTFYIEDANRAAPIAEPRLRALRDALTAVVSSS